MPKLRQRTILFLKYLPLLLIAVLLFCFFYFNLYKLISFETLRHHQQLLLQWKNDNYLFTVCVYITLYTVAIAASFPGAIFFTLAGGFLFGSFPGSLYVVFSITLGSTLFFLAIRMALAAWLEKKAGHWLQKMEQGFRENAFNYLLTLRLIPIIPFWLTNIIAGLLDLKLATFVSATFFGIIPSVLIYTAVGQSLGTLLMSTQKPTISLILQPHFLLPLSGLAVLALSPVIYKQLRKKNSK